MKNLMITTAALILISVASLKVDAQFLWNPDGVELRKTTHISYQPLSVKNSLDEMFIIWMDSRDGRSKFYAQKYDFEGNALWNEDVEVADNTENNQFGQLIICPTSDDGFILVWGKQIWFDAYMIANKVDRDGNVLWGAEGINIGDYAIGYKLVTIYNIIPTDDGGFSVVFFRHGEGEQVDLCAKRLLSDGSTAPGWEEEGNLIRVDVPISVDINGYFATFSCTDDANGLIVSWLESTGTTSYTANAQHINGSGDFMWGVSGVEIAIQPSMYSIPKAAKDGDGGAFFVWESAAGLDMQRIDDSGSRLWGDSGLSLCSQPDNQNEAMIQYDGQGGFIAAWEDERNLYSDDIYCQRVNGDGDKLWGANDLALCTMTGNQAYVQIDADGTGGLSASWRHWDSGGLSHLDVYTQAVSADGQIYWQNNGLLISGGVSDNAYGQSVVSTGQGEAIFTMNVLRDNVGGIYLQRIDRNSTIQFPYPGEPVVESLGGGAFNFELKAIDENNFLCVWQDSRAGYRTYFQIFDANGNIELPENGLPLCEASNYSQENPHSDVTSEGHIITCWEDERFGDYNLRLFAQKINGDGNILWNPSGVQLSTYDGRQCWAMIMADEEGGAYIVWLESLTNIEVFVQHIDINGYLLFGSEGVRIQWNISDDWAELIGLVPDGENGVIIVYDDKDTMCIHALRVRENGTEAWDHYVYDIGDRNYGAFVIPSSEGAIVVWEDERSPRWDHDIYAQKVDFNGNMLWEINGVPVIIQPNSNQRYPAMVEDDEGFIFFAWEDKRNINEDIYCQRLNSDGVRQFEGAGIPVCFNDGDINNIDILPDGNGGVFLTWEDERTIGYWDIYATHLNSDGEIADPVWVENGNPVVDEVGGQHHPWMVPDGDGGAIVAWSDNRAASGQDLYMQRFNDTFASVSGDDKGVPDKFSLSQNYPNPFNPSTILSYSLPIAGKITLTIYDITGREVGKLVDGMKPAGVHSVKFDAKDLTSGVYFARLTAGEFRGTRKLLLIK